MRLGVSVLLVSVGAFALLSAQTLPPASQQRAERFDEWRASIHTAERALARGRLEEAADAYQSVVTEAERLEDRSLLHARALDGLATVRLRQGLHEEAERLFTRCIPLWERLLGGDQPRIAVTLNHLAVARMHGGNCEGAREAFRRALTILDATADQGSNATRTAREGLHELDRRCPDGE